MKFILPVLFSLFITGCQLTNINQNNKSMPTQKPAEKKPLKTITTDNSIIEFQLQEEHVYSNLNDTILDIADQLFYTKTNHKNKTRVILTSFVDLEKLNKTSTFGRLISESMFNELHIRKFLVTDFRGQEAVSVNEDGEFHITRDVERLKDNVAGIEYILVGTYVKFENQSLLINARILDSISGMVLSSARVVYRPKDCSLFDLCIKKEIVKPKKKVFFKELQQENKKQVQNSITDESQTPIMIIEDN